jgi:Recombinase
VYSPTGRVVEWGAARYNTIYRVLTNPIYAGTYVYGRTGSQVRIEYGRKRISRGIPRPQDKWDVLIHDHHKGYISWNDYERNQGIINSNANMKGAMVKGSVREGGGVLAGLLRCGHCGRKLTYCTTTPTVRRDTCAATRGSIMAPEPIAYRSAICALTRRCREKFCE